MKYRVTDIIGQPHIFNTENGTVRLYANKSVDIEGASLPKDVELEEKHGFVLVEEAVGKKEGKKNG